MPKMTLTQVFVDTLVCPMGKSKEDYFDTKTTGLVVQVSLSGRKTYYLRYQNERKVTVQRKLVCASSVKLIDARELAKKQLSQIALGSDPFDAKKILKDVPTVAEFVIDNYLPYVKTYKRSWDTDASLIKNHVLPNFGKLYMDDISKKDIIQFISQHAKTHKPGSVNRVIILLRYIFNLSIRWETPGITKNPTADIPLLEENNKKERFLTADEAKALVEKLKESDNKMLQYIIPMLILTGARKNEVLKAKWQDFNLGQKVWRIPISKSGKARYVPLSTEVVNLLSQLPRFEACPYVVPNPRTKLPYASIDYAWDNARKKAGLAEVRMHDLRHSFASFLVNAGRSLYEVQKILGHSQLTTTQRYAHLSQATLLDATNAAASAAGLKY